MGLNRMMMKNGEVKVEDGSKYWTYIAADAKTIAFTVPPRVKRIKVFAEVDYAEGEPDIYRYVSIKNKMTNKIWGEGWSETDHKGENMDHQDIDSIVGVTPNKTYELLFNCFYTHGVTFSWGKAINDMTPIVEDY